MAEGRRRDPELRPARASESRCSAGLGSREHPIGKEEEEGEGEEGGWLRGAGELGGGEGNCWSNNPERPQ